MFHLAAKNRNEASAINRKAGSFKILLNPQTTY